ncbi:hypothetical protein LCGC14_0353490 [marine sediment metagenome]|uniref:KOW domain-containing protein n=1 Tax=marine sediment metagenome TaxID=412755 RepID=A0A0F9TT35_9ZZZZ
MAQNQAHIGDTVGVVVGELKGQQGTIVAFRINDNRCMVRIAADHDPNDYFDYQYHGTELKLLDCHHMGVITSE